MIPLHDVVFLGPSVDPTLARSSFSGVIRPPIRRGQLDQLIQGADPPLAVGIVDGRFLQDLAVSPKEVVRALDAGVTIYGASSIGALRAAECAPFGAIGVGRIFHMFRTGEMEADDEVAITYDPDTLRATSEPMVNIRIAMAHAVATDAVEAGTAELVVETADQLYFPDRSYRNIGRMIAGRVSATELHRYQTFVGSGSCPDQKRDDALRLLATMGEAAQRRTAGGRP